MFNFLKNLFNWSKKNEKEPIAELETKVQEPIDDQPSEETNSTILELAKTTPPEGEFSAKLTIVENSEPISEIKTEKKKPKRKYYPKKKKSVDQVASKEESPKDVSKTPTKRTRSRKNKSE